jgi:hypothetical protein
VWLFWPIARVDAHWIDTIHHDGLNEDRSRQPNSSQVPHLAIMHTTT